MNQTKKIIVGMSGGVDSSVTALILLKKKYLVEGLFMKNWEEDDNNHYCASAKDLADTLIICDYLKIKLHTVNFSAEYWDKVFSDFIAGIRSGYTPNPDILCNKEIKFKVFLKYAINNLGADYIATGHYVRIGQINSRLILMRGLDKNKDQSYFLYTLNDKQLNKTIFPIGSFKKTEVRNLARQHKMITANKKDSVGICFIGKKKFRDFIKHYLPPNPGDIVDINGNILGKHQGLMYYTIGQRKGLGIGGLKKYGNIPWYVVEKNIPNNQLIVNQGNNNPNLMSIGLIAQHLHWAHLKQLTYPINCLVKTRYRQIDEYCTIIPIGNNCVKVKFNRPVSAITPGQSAVFYINDYCIGGGVIQKRIPISNTF